MAEPEPTGAHRELVDDTVVAPRLFLAIGGFIAGMALIYWFTAYEEAGTAMLTGAALLAVWSGFYLWLRWRTMPASADGADSGHPADTVPTVLAGHPSIWPFVLGLGTTVLFDGLTLGNWILLPGGLLTALGIVGFILESRR